MKREDRFVLIARAAIKINQRREALEDAERATARSSHSAFSAEYLEHVPCTSGEEMFA